MLWQSNQPLRHSSDDVYNTKLTGLKNACRLLHKSCSDLTSRFDRVFEAQLGVTSQESKLNSQDLVDAYA